MSEIFNKSFFKFLIGFLGMITLSFLVIFSVGYYASELRQGSTDATLSPIEADLSDATVEAVR